MSESPVKPAGGSDGSPAIEAAPWGDLFVTATGNFHVFREEHFKLMKEGAIMANSGHFDDELDLNALDAMAGGQTRQIRRDLQEYCLDGTRRVYSLRPGALEELDRWLERYRHFWRDRLDHLERHLDSKAEDERAREAT